MSRPAPRRTLALVPVLMLTALGLAACTPPQGANASNTGGLGQPESSESSDAAGEPDASPDSTSSNDPVGPSTDLDADYAAGLPAGVSGAPTEAIAGAGWSPDGATLYVTTIGSSSCPRVATDAVVVGTTVTVELTQAGGAVCTMDMVPTTTTMPAPAGATATAEVSADLGDLGTATIPPATDPVAMGWIEQTG